MTDIVERLKRSHLYSGDMSDAIGEIMSLRKALSDICMLERTQQPDMSGKKRTYAMMQNGTVLAEALDKARDLLGIPIGQMVPQPTHDDPTYEHEAMTDLQREL